MLLTVLTPTYNRAYIINKLYNSLLKQTNNDFKWLIIDDGSSDNTKELVDGYIKENLIKIEYIKKSNGGKHTAINEALKYIYTDLVIIVDSDDYLTEDAVETINKVYQKYKNDNTLGFYSFLRENSNEEILCKPQNNEFIDNYLNIRIKNNLKGDMAEVFISNVIKQFRFVEFKNEKFLSEDTLWIEIAKKYDTLFINEPIYVCDYQNDGITLNDKKVKFKSPLGSIYRGKQLMCKDCGLLVNIKGAIIYNCYKLEVDNIPKELNLENNYQKMLIIVTKCLGYCFNLWWKRTI